jgi:hypothetical protein
LAPSLFESKHKQHYKQYFLKYLTNVFTKKGLFIKTYYLLNKANFLLLFKKNYNFLNSDGSSNLFKPNLHLLNFFSNFKFLFFYFCERLNKKLYKYSNYRLSRYSFKFYYVKPFNRFKKLLKVLSKLTLLYSEKSIAGKISLLLYNILFKKKNLFILKLIRYIQRFIFKNYRINLFYLLRSV